MPLQITGIIRSHILAREVLIDNTLAGPMIRITGASFFPAPPLLDYNTEVNACSSLWTEHIPRLMQCVPQPEKSFAH